MTLRQRGAPTGITSVTYSDRDAAISTTPTNQAAMTSTYAKSGNLERLTAGSTSFRTGVLSPAPASSTNGGTTTWTVRDPNGELLAIRVGASNTPSASTSYYVFSDQVESVRSLVKADGTLSNSYTYTAFGVSKTSQQGVANPYRFGAGYTESSNGLIKMGFRYYDPSSGRFTQIDPSGLSRHDYAYVSSSPASLYDPSGLVQAYAKLGVEACALVCAGVSIGGDSDFDLTVSVGVGADVSVSGQAGGGVGSNEGGAVEFGAAAAAGAGVYGEASVSEGNSWSGGGGLEIGYGGGVSTGLSYTF